MLNNYEEAMRHGRISRKKRMKKLGTLKMNFVESTPVVWEDKLLRFEWVRPKAWCASGQIDRETGHYHFVDMATEEEVAKLGEDHSFGSCHAENGKMFVYGGRGTDGGQIIDCFYSSDMQNWESEIALTLPENVGVLNTSVCKGDGEFVMIIEVAGKNPKLGFTPTLLFAKSQDLVHWTLLDIEEYNYLPDRYTACPCIRYADGYYYIIYLEGAPCARWVPYIARSRDLKDFELGLTNPVMWPDDDDKQVIYPEFFTAEQLDYLEHAVDCNNSDFDMCEYHGKTVITYSWGNQLGKEFLALAEFDGTNEEFLKSFFE